MAKSNAAPLEEEDLPPEAEPTLREQILAARDEVLEVAPEPGEPPAEPAPQPRGDKGRFARKEPETPPVNGERRASPDAGRPQPISGEQPPAPELTPEQKAAQDAAAAAAKPPDVALAPQYWSTSAKAEWAKLPELVRKEIAQREASMHRELTKQDQERQFTRQFNQALQPFNDVVQRTGVHPIRLMTDTLAVLRTLQVGSPAEKFGVLRAIAERNGVDFRALLPNAPAPGTGAPAPGSAPATSELPPAVMASLAESQRIAREWEEFKGRQAQEAQEMRTRMEQQVLDEINTFRTRPEARFFDQVRDHMQVLLAGGAAQTLEEAYDQAIHARPDIRAVLDKEAADAQAAARAKLDRVRQARARGGSVRGSAGGAAPAAPQDRTLRQELQANFAEARSRI